jgi:hypothetical protein
MFSSRFSRLDGDRKLGDLIPVKRTRIMMIRITP